MCSSYKSALLRVAICSCYALTASANDQWTNCTPAEVQPRELSIGLAISSKLFQDLGSKAEARTWAENVVNGANFIFMSQLNIRMVIKDLYIQEAPDTSVPWNDPGCDMSVGSRLEKFAEWAPPSKQGLWQLLDACFSGTEFSEVTGQAFVGTLCDMDPQNGKYLNTGLTERLSIPVLGDLTWRVFAHEVGHTFGAGHPFGTAFTVNGGIMAHGTGHYECELEFHPKDKDDVCPALAEAEQNCLAFTPLSMSREAFLLQLPDAPAGAVDLNIVQCGLFGLTFVQFCVIASAAFVCCCCTCCCFCFMCRRGCRRRKRSHDSTGFV